MHSNHSLLLHLLGKQSWWQGNRRRSQSLYESENERPSKLAAEHELQPDCKGISRLDVCSPNPGPLQLLELSWMWWAFPNLVISVLIVWAQPITSNSEWNLPVTPNTVVAKSFSLFFDLSINGSGSGTDLGVFFPSLSETSKKRHPEQQFPDISPHHKTQEYGWFLWEHSSNEWEWHYGKYSLN